MSWDNTGGGASLDWDDGGAAVAAVNTFGNDDGLAVGATADTFNGGGGGGGAGGGGGFSGGCFNCGEEGHGKAECPHPPKPRPCYNCGEEGHQKIDCPNPARAHVFTGTCRICEQQGHRAADCPDAPLKPCNNCDETGHVALDCTKPRKIKYDSIESMPAEKAWEQMKIASDEHDLDEFKKALQKYMKATPDATYVQLETAFRIQNFNFYFIALEKEIQETFSNMDLQGNLGKKYSISLRKSANHQRPKEKELWPTSPEENLARLVDAGEPVYRGIPKCSNCEALGHIAKACPEERQERTDRAEVKCFNCDEVGHRVRDCPTERLDKFACRNCGKSGHGSKECPEPRSADGVECKNCSEIGHFSKDCPQGGGGGGGCRNCGEEGHFAKDCTNERKIICRNCDAEGHQSRECPKPRDYSRVKCMNCQQMGHTKVRCKEPLIEEYSGGANGQAGGSGGTGAHGFGAVGGGDDFGSGAVTAPVDENSWGAAPAVVTGGGDDWGSGETVAQTGW